LPPSVETCKKSFALRARALRGVQKVAKWISRDGWRWASPRKYRARGTAPPRARTCRRGNEDSARMRAGLQRAPRRPRWGALWAMRTGRKATAPLRNLATVGHWMAARVARRLTSGSRNLAACWRLPRSAPRASRAASTACSARPPGARPEIALPAPHGLRRGPFMFARGASRAPPFHLRVRDDAHLTPWELSAFSECRLRHQSELQRLLTLTLL